jgi:hypothetical protein
VPLIWVRGGEHFVLNILCPEVPREQDGPRALPELLPQKGLIMGIPQQIGGSSQIPVTPTLLQEGQYQLQALIAGTGTVVVEFSFIETIFLSFYAAELCVLFISLV